MRYLVLLLIVFSWIIVISNCDDSSVNGRVPTSSFPLEVGNWWSYEGLSIFQNVNNPIPADTFAVLSIYRTVERIDTLNSINNIYVLKDSLRRETFNETTYTNYRYWLKIESDTLWEYAYQYNNVIDVNHIPMARLTFPLIEGRSWEYRPSTQWFRSSEVLGQESVNVMGENLLCDHVIRYNINTSNNDTTAYDNRWFTGNGLVKRETYYLENYNPRDNTYWELTGMEIQ